MDLRNDPGQPRGLLRRGGRRQQLGGGRPSVLRPDGTMVYFSGNSTGQNAVYGTVAGTWTHSAAMDFPLVPGQTYHYAVADGPAHCCPTATYW